MVQILGGELMSYEEITKNLAAIRNKSLDELMKIYNKYKDIKDENGNLIDTKKNRILDPKAVLIIGNRNAEFPHIRNSEFDMKTDCFERMRRDSRNIEIVTYDELFERAFHIVFPAKLPKDWFDLDTEFFKSNVLKV